MLLGMLVSIGTARAATQERIGSWLLSCPGETTGSEPCRLRTKEHLFDEDGITGDLEIQVIGKSLVPVIALRGLPPELLAVASLAGKAEAWIRLDDGSRENLTCAPSADAYICAPKDHAAANLAAQLPAARSITVRVSVTVNGLKPLTAREKSLDLTGTNTALARLRVAGAPQVPAGPITAQSPGRLAAMADKALKSAGYPNGLADLQTLLAKYKGK